MQAGILRHRAALPLLVFALCAAVYVATLGKRAAGVSDNAHFLFLAESLLQGQLSLVADKPPGDNDWARYEGRWYVSFPPFPAVVAMPLVALFGTAAWDRLFWALFAGLAPALLLLLLRSLREQGLSDREPRDDLALCVLFAFGSVYYYTSVQGTVWFAAHLVACALIALYLLAAFGARRPLLAGCLLAACFMTRPSSLLLGLFFVLQALQRERRAGEGTGVRAWLSEIAWRPAIGRLAWFGAPLLAVGVLAMALNYVRFDDPLVFGHQHLEIRWRRRIETWGLFNYHYVARNLAVVTSSLPWLSAEPPYVKISRHGLALWITTPHLLLLLWPRRWTPTMVSLALAAGAVALLDLCYQNSGWIQFGYRFSLDYMIPLVVLLALGGRRFGKGFHLFLAIAVAINLFGAVTFDRAQRFYDQDATQRVIFQPD
jgi:hypothetical protein